MSHKARTAAAAYVTSSLRHNIQAVLGRIHGAETVWILQLIDGDRIIPIRVVVVADGTVFAFKISTETAVDYRMPAKKIIDRYAVSAQRIF